jgi:membrane associated rhomboid family serine protease
MFEKSTKSNRGILLGQDNNALVYLVAINLLVFVLLTFIKIIYYLSEIPIEFFYKQVFDWFTLPAVTDNFLNKPWVIFTYMFTHDSIWGLISSLLWLWAFGYILQDLTGNNKLIPIYLYGGFAGGIVFLITVNLFPALANHVTTLGPLMGAGAAVMAIAVATTTLAPEYRIFPLINGGIPLWVLMVVFVAIDFASLAGNNAGIAASHLTGGAIGFLFIRQLRRGSDWGTWMNHFIDWLNDLFSPDKKRPQKDSRDNLFAKSLGNIKQKKSDITQTRIDALLDKINQQGYQFLTDEEKSFLKRASKEDLL